MIGVSIRPLLALAVLATIAFNPWIAARKNRSPWLRFVIGVPFSRVAFLVLLFRPTLPRVP